MASQYPNGFKNGFSVRGLPLTQTHPGKVFWVSNSTAMLPNQKSGSDGNDGSFNAPFATLDYAVGQCTAGRGDVIFVKPGHAESIIAAGTVALDVAGIAVIGLGYGGARPTFTYTTATSAAIQVAASNIVVQNILFVGGLLNVAAAITVANATVAKDFVVDGCEFRDSSTILNFVKIINVGTTANIADGLTFTNNRVIGKASTPAAGTTVVTLGSDSTRVTISDNFVNHDIKLEDTPALLEGGALNHTSLLIERNRVYRANTTCSGTGHLVGSSSTASTGMLNDNYVKTLDVAAMLLIPVSTKLGFNNNLLSGTADTSGIVIPAADSDGS